MLCCFIVNVRFNLVMKPGNICCRWIDVHIWKSTVPVPLRHFEVYGTSKMNKTEAYQYLSQLCYEGRIDTEASSSYHLPTLWFPDIDLEILKDPPLRDLKEVAQAVGSTIRVNYVTSHPEIEVGDHLTVLVDLRDLQGRPVRKGGHSVRVWMTSESNKSAAADVHDLKNGSYLASLPVLWPGKTTVVASMMRPREYRGMMLRLLNEMKAVFLNTALYEQNGTSQVTYCLSIPAVPVFPEVCNMTSLNYGLPWYCGKPSKENLTCSHWVKTRSTVFPIHYHLTKTEDQLLQTYFMRYVSLYYSSASSSYSSVI